MALISLGCPKNLVDSEVMLARLAECGFSTKSDMGEADVVVINTCSFLNSARDEAEQWIRDAVRLKRQGSLKGVVVAGCLPALERDRLFEGFDEIDAILGPRDRLKIAEACDVALEANGRKASFLDDSDSLVRRLHPRAISTGRHTAYLKIAEGCNNKCSYCLIPRIRGNMVSRSMQSLVDEASRLAQSGVRELSLIAQDTTNYGVDLYGRPRLASLLKGLSRVEGVDWLRLLYTHPAHWSDEIVEAFAENPKLCRYVDIPVQHFSEKVLRLMRRRTSQRALVRVLEKMRMAVPGISLRTTVMVGFPGEGEKEFAELLGFLRDFRFDHLGAFAYSREQTTGAARLPNQVPEDVKEERLHRVMEAQQEISRSRNEAMVGREVTVLVDSVGPTRTRGVARTEGQAFEVDGVVRTSGANLQSGQFLKVLIVGFNEYDLFGRRFSEDVLTNQAVGKTTITKRRRVE
ncbi:MAG: 30S ribosomal protein S12 methylthiotransferase RimO [Candidatus Eisenbacteria bacterium]|nr:30S ribosomal protein S12 methylthiotransferase RimO [Candidatus Eisenbacteria bacterium]